MFHQTIHKLLLFAIGLLITLSYVQITSQVSLAYANDENQSMHSLLERLKQQVNQGTDFTLALQLSVPLTDGGDLWWSFPYFNENPDIQRALGEIGDDYVCIEELAGQGFTIRCVPFSNIVEIVYSPH